MSSHTGDEDDVFDESDEAERNLIKKDLQRARQRIYNIWYREGLSAEIGPDGDPSPELQAGFDSGYKEAFEVGRNLASLRARVAVTLGLMEQDFLPESTHSLKSRLQALVKRANELSEQLLHLSRDEAFLQKALEDCTSDSPRLAFQWRANAIDKMKIEEFEREVVEALSSVTTEGRN